MRKVSGSNSMMENSVWASLVLSIFCRSAQRLSFGTSTAPPTASADFSLPGSFSLLGSRKIFNVH